jgi:hypothetical protein
MTGDGTELFPILELSMPRLMIGGFLSKTLLTAGVEWSLEHHLPAERLVQSLHRLRTGKVSIIILAISKDCNATSYLRYGCRTC